MRLFLFAFVLFSSASASKILVVVLSNSKSHIGSMLPFAEALSKNGHDVTVYVETVGDLGALKHGVKSHYVMLSKESINKWMTTTLMDLAWNHDSTPNIWWHLFDTGNTALFFAIKQESFWQIANQTWDFIVSDEMFTTTGWGMGMLHKKRFGIFKLSMHNGPVSYRILRHGTPHAVYSTTTMLHAHTTMLSLNRNPVISPSYYTSLDVHESWSIHYFLNRAKFVGQAIFEYAIIVSYGEWTTRDVIDQMGYSDFSWVSYYGDASMVFIDYPDRLAWPVPMGNDFVYTGSTCPDSKPLPADLEEFVSDPTSKGTILIAFGTHIQWDLAPRRVVHAFFDAVNNLSDYRIIWSYRGTPLDVKSHVKLMEWLPQNDLLNHPRTKLFFSHGGLKSVKEAICSETPVLYMPLFAEQVRSAVIANQLGFAEYINKKTVNAQEIIAKMSKVLSKDTYPREAAKVKSLFVDRIMDPLEEAVFWTEHLLRSGYRRMKRAGMKLNWLQFVYADVIALILGGVTLFGWKK